MDMSVQIGFILLLAICIILYSIWRSQPDTGTFIRTKETDRFNPYIKYIASPKKTWNALGYGGIVLITGVVFIASLFVIWLLGTLINTVIINSNLSFGTTTIGSTTGILIISGVCLLFTIIIHELGHGVYVAITGKETTVGAKILFIFPTVAYVKQEDTDTSILESLKITSGGVLFNFISILIISLLLFGIVIPAITPVDGAGVAQVQSNSPIDNANIEPGDVITSVNGNAVTSHHEARNEFRHASEQTLHVTLASGETKTIERELQMRHFAIEYAGLRSGESITHLNGQEIYSLEQVSSIVGENSHASITTSNGAEIDIPIGVLREHNDDKILITHVNENRIHTERDVRVLSSQFENDQVSIKAITVDTDEEIETTINSSTLIDNQNGDMSGITFIEYGLSFYPSDSYLNVISNPSTATSLVESTNTIPNSITSLPGFGFIALIIALPILLYPPSNVLPYGFVGFIGIVENFYTVTGPLSFMGDGILVIASFMIAFILVSILTIIVNSIPMTGTDGWKIAYYYMFIFSQILRENEFIDEITDYKYTRNSHPDGDVYIPESNESITLEKLEGENGIRNENQEEHFDPYAYNVMSSIGQIFTYTMVVIAFWLII